MLGREGIALSRARAHRLWRKARLSLPRRRPRRRIRRNEPRPFATSEPNEVWAYDFVFDRCTDGQPIECLTILDEGSRECPAIDVAGSIRSRRVIEVRADLVAARGAPLHMRSDNGPEFVAYAVQDRLREEKIATTYIEPGKPWQNGMNESFNLPRQAPVYDQDAQRNTRAVEAPLKGDLRGRWRSCPARQGARSAAAA